MQTFSLFQQGSPFLWVTKNKQRHRIAMNQTLSPDLGFDISWLIHHLFDFPASHNSQRKILNLKGYYPEEKCRSWENQLCLVIDRQTVRYVAGKVHVTFYTGQDISLGWQQSSLGPVCGLYKEHSIGNCSAKPASLSISYTPLLQEVWAKRAAVPIPQLCRRHGVRCAAGALIICILPHGTSTQGGMLHWQGLPPRDPSPAWWLCKGWGVLAPGMEKIFSAPAHSMLASRCCDKNILAFPWLSNIILQASMRR